VPCLMITVGHDPALPPAFTKNMHRFIPDLTFRHVEPAGHWVLVEQPDTVNSYLREFTSRLFHTPKL
ncbi:Bifunctional epoxide hydrolase 2, partial [Smittium mucronatum]